MAFSIQTELKLKRKNIPTKSLFLNTFKSTHCIAIHVMEIMLIQRLLYKYSVAQQFMTNQSLHNFLFSIPMTARHTAHSYPALIDWNADHSYVAPCHVQTVNYFFDLSGSAILLVIVSQMAWYYKKSIQHKMCFNFLHNVFLNLFPSCNELSMILHIYTGLRVKYLLFLSNF